MVRIRVSYEQPEELQEVVSRLGSGVKCVKLPRSRGSGRFQRAYIDLDGVPGRNSPCTDPDRMV